MTRHWDTDDIVEWIATWCAWEDPRVVEESTTPEGGTFLIRGADMWRRVHISWDAMRQIETRVDELRAEGDRIRKRKRR